MSKQSIKRVMCALVCTISVMVNTVTAFAATEVDLSANNSAQMEINNNLISLFSSYGIGATVINNQVVLNDLSDVKKANDLLKQTYEQRNMARTSYPTSYYGPFDEYYSTEKLEKASKTAVTATLSAWATGVRIPKILVATFVSSYFSYWFVESDTQDVYSYVAYYYSELGPGFIDEWAGNFVGDYRIKKVSRLTTNSDYTGGSVKTEYEDSSQLIPF